MDYIQEIYGIGAPATNLRKLTPAEEKLADRYFLYVDWFQFLLSKGYPRKIIPLVIAQMQHETGDFTSKNANRRNNFSGIKYDRSAANMWYVDGKDGAYATYKNKDRWAADMLRIISMKGSAGRPVDAVDYGDYANRLKKNGYYGDTFNNYKNGLLYFIKKNNDAYAWAHKFHQDMVKDANNKDFWYYLTTRLGAGITPVSPISDLTRNVVRAVNDYRGGVDNKVIKPADTSKGDWSADNAAVAKEEAKQSAVKWKWDWENLTTGQKFLLGGGILAGVVVVGNLTR